MTQENRLKLAKHYLSLDEKGRRRQEGLARYVPELEGHIKEEKAASQEKKSILQKIKEGFMPTPGAEN